MSKYISPHQLLLFILATLLLLLAAFSFYLLQDPTAPLPFVPPPPSSTITPLPPSPSYTAEPSATSMPTRQTSYTPFASPAITDSAAPTDGTLSPPTAVTEPGVTGTLSTVPGSTTTTSTIQPVATSSVSPTASQTLMTGEYLITGRAVQNGTPMANAVIEFSDDNPTRKSSTDPGGHYSFITLAPGTTFTLAFDQDNNPQLTPDPEIAPLAWIEGTLPTGVITIALPDLDVSLNIEGMVFRLVTPVDGAAFSAAVISQANPLQFIWAFYYLGDTYFVELGPNGSDEPAWISGNTTSTNMMWNGTLDDGSHISKGAYWWRVGVNKSLGIYKLIAFTPKWDLVFNP
jgi:hypothetical protein